jgi:hypothetical protein
MATTAVLPTYVVSGTAAPEHLPAFVVSGTVAPEHLPAWVVSGTVVEQSIKIPPAALGVYITKATLPTYALRFSLYWQPSGGAVAGGQANVVGVPWIPNGGAVAGGAAHIVFPWNPIGGAVGGGSAPVSGVTVNLYDLSIDGEPAGGAIVGGAALIQDVIPYKPQGGAVAGGAAVVQEAIKFLPAGGAVASGAAAASQVFAPSSSGGAVASGAAPVVFVAAITPSGGAYAGGAAPISSVSVVIYPAEGSSGGAVAGGAAVVADRQAFHAGSGGVLLGGSALAYRVPAGFTPTAANPYADAFPGWNVNFETGAPARLLGLPANSFAQLGGVTYVANAAGVFALDGASDAGSPIRARVLLPKSDETSVHNKRVPAVWIAGEMERGMVMQVIAGDELEAYYAVDPPDAELQVSRVEPGRGLEGRFIQLGFGNVQGADFTLESVEAPLSILKRHGR